MALRVALTVEQCWHRVPGGTAVAVIELAAALSRRDDVEPIGVAARHAMPPPRVWVPPIPVHHLPIPRRPLYEAWGRLRRPRVERATGPVDIVHATAVAVPPRSVPIVLTIHDLAWRKEPGHFTSWGVRFFQRHLTVALREADLVLCSSAATRDECEEAGFAPERLRVVPLGVSIPTVSDEQVDAVRARYQLPRPFVMWTGTREPRKNLPGLLAAFLELDRPDLDLVLVGPPGWGDEIDTVLDGLRSRVHVLGFVSRDDQAALCSAAQLFCFPSIREGFGLPVLEAMAQHTPVVTSLGTATAEFGPDAAVLVDPRDPSSIAAGMAAVLDGTVKVSRLTARGADVAAEHTWDRTAELTVAAYEEVRS